MGIDLDNFGPVRLSHRILNMNPDTLNFVITIIAVYSVLLFAQGIGLWSMKRWGEYVAAVATSVFIPFEIHELVEQVTWVRVSVLVFNILLVLTSCGRSDYSDSVAESRPLSKRCTANR